MLASSRLPIPVLLSEEALHGLIWPGFTVFPQQIALAGTFEPPLARRQGRAIATEVRSTGVCETWSPVLDLARDPRWGRVEEGYGEDTFLASDFAGEMVLGLQGDDLKAPDAIVAEVKHFTGYGAPVGGLNCAPATFGRHEHAAYCLPVFEAAFRAGAVNAMCSYNAIDNVPVAGDRTLLTDVLRGDFGMPGFVRADMTAVAMLHTCHFTAETPRDAIRQGLEAGVDMQLYDFPHEVWQQTILDLVHSGEMAQTVLDTAVSRVLRVKFLLGLFERPYVDEALSASVVHCPAHVDVALDVARSACSRTRTACCRSTGTCPASRSSVRVRQHPVSATTAPKAAPHPRSRSSTASAPWHPRTPRCCTPKAATSSAPISPPFRPHGSTKGIIPDSSQHTSTQSTVRVPLSWCGTTPRCASTGSTPSPERA